MPSQHINNINWKSPSMVRASVKKTVREIWLIAILHLIGKKTWDY